MMKTFVDPRCRLALDTWRILVPDITEPAGVNGSSVKLADAASLIEFWFILRSVDCIRVALIENVLISSLRKILFRAKLAGSESRCGISMGRMLKIQAEVQNVFTVRFFWRWFVVAFKESFLTLAHMPGNITYQSVCLNKPAVIQF